MFESIDDLKTILVDVFPKNPIDPLEKQKGGEKIAIKDFIFIKWQKIGIENPVSVGIQKVRFENETEVADGEPITIWSPSTRFELCYHFTEKDREGIPPATYRAVVIEVKDGEKPFFAYSLPFEVVQ